MCCPSIGDKEAIRHELVPRSRPSNDDAKFGGSLIGLLLSKYLFSQTAPYVSQN